MSSSSINPPSLSNDIASLPKKRGRKPKIGIVSVIVPDATTIENTANPVVNTLVIDDSITNQTTTTSEKIVKQRKPRAKKVVDDTTEKKVKETKQKKVKETTEKKVKEKTVKEKKQEEEVGECPCCVEKYTPILRKKVVCKYCNVDTCSKCIERYLLEGINDAHCMHCRVNYNDTTLREICTMTYVQQVYFKHRQEVLLNREKANLPGLQDEALEERAKREREAKYAEMRKELLKMEDILKEMNDNYYNVYNEYYSKLHTKENVDDINKRLLKINIEMDKYRDEIHKFKLAMYDVKYPARIDAAGNKVDAEKEERKKFIRRCTRDNCQGFLSSAWKCGLCEYYSCSKCFITKGKKQDDPHECKQEDIETAELIKKDSKPCPNCGEFIMKSSGCSQMFCITCKTPWDWNTGKVVVGGMIHNPHYYEWMRRNGNAEGIRNPADVPCGGYPNGWELRRIPRTVRSDLSNKFYEFHRICQEIQDISQRTYRSHIDNTTAAINIKFLLNDYDETHWGQLLGKNERKRKRDSEVQEIFGAFRMVAVELINRIQNYVKPDAFVAGTRRPITIEHLLPIESEPMLQQFSIEVDALIDMINDAMKQVSIGYHYVVPNITKSGKNNEYYALIHKNFYEDVKDDKRKALANKAASAKSKVKLENTETKTTVKTDIPMAGAGGPPVIEVPPNEYFKDDSDDDSTNDTDMQAAITASLQ